jgi:hypothetical protein
MNYYKTDRLDVAIYIVATDSLKFSHVEDGERPGKIMFVFHDQLQRGEDLMFAFDRGSLAPANAVLASQRQLRQKMDQDKQRNTTQTTRGVLYGRAAFTTR